MNVTRRTHYWSNTITAEAPDAAQRLRAEAEPCGRTTILHVRGMADAHTLTPWRRLLESAIGATAIEGGRHLIIDLTTVEFMSLRTIFALAELTRSGQRLGVGISVVEARPYAVTGRIVEITGLTDWLPVYPELVDALAAAQSELSPAAGGARRATQRASPGPPSATTVRNPSATRPLVPAPPAGSLLQSRTVMSDHLDRSPTPSIDTAFVSWPDPSPLQSWWEQVMHEHLIAPTRGRRSGQKTSPTGSSATGH
ncbi:STAS domain-containing protein [Nocardia sp. XZ_19_231]|uniref:STAS domain-containing protein n=1 Tax=Nocardia sp. XZ_19_231 TaxID=2769252 RepID=UPI00188F588E|nr:STAS domain-containing protein [Nocardia sp. XZ_19_231]